MSKHKNGDQEDEWERPLPDLTDLSQKQRQEVASAYKMLANPIRARIVYALLEGKDRGLSYAELLQTCKDFSAEEMDYHLVVLQEFKFAFHTKERHRAEQVWQLENQFRSSLSEAIAAMRTPKSA